VNRWVAVLALALAAAPAWADDAADLRAAELAIAARDYDQGAALLIPILDDPAKEASHAVAWARLGDLWADNDFPNAAVLAWAEAAKRDPNALGPSLSRAVQVARETGDEASLEPWFAALPADLPEPGRTSAAVLGARFLIRGGKYAEAIALIGTVDSAHPDYARAQDLRGVAFSNQKMWGEALAALLLAQAASESSPPEERAMITHNLGRAYYGSGNYLKAVEHLGSVPRGSLAWQDAQFERAWAHFAIDDHVGTISVLQTWESPWFTDWYAPEADLLRLQAYFLLCKLVSAREEADRFEAKYTPMRNALDVAVPTLTPTAAWTDIIGWMDGEESKLPPGILYKFRYEERFDDAVALVKAIDAEGVRAEKNPAAWISRAAPMLRARRGAVIEAEGARVLARATAARAEIASILEDVPMLKLDLLTLESEFYSRAAITGTLEYGDRIGKLRDLRQQPGVRAWPAEGEAWADELGYVRYDVRTDCPEEPPR